MNKENGKVVLGEIQWSRDLKYLLKCRKISQRERAKEKCLEGRRQIQSLNWKNENGKEPVYLLPKEIWEMVLDFLDSPQDLSNAGNTCPLFQELLEKRRLSSILLPLVLEIPEFRRQLDPLCKPEGSSTSQLLALRLTCKSWRNAVDSVIQDNLVKMKLCPNDSRLDPHHLPSPPLRLGCPTNLEESDLPTFLQSYGATPAGLKLISRSLEVTMTGLFSPIENLKQNVLPFCKLLSKLLELIGSDIWSFEFEVYSLYHLIEYGLPLQELYLMLQRWIRLMPNLHFLELRFLGKFLWSWESYTVSGSSLEDVIKLYPFPSLGKLKRLKLRFDNDLVRVEGISILEAALESNQHLQNLEVDSHTGIGQGRLLQLIQSLPLEAISLYSYSQWPLKDQVMTHVVNLNWPLAKIKLEFQGHKPHHTLQLPKVFRLLEKFQTLENVNLHVNDECLGDGGGGPEFFLDLKNLTNFHFSFDHEYRHSLGCMKKSYFHGVDYLLKAERLEELTWINYALFRIRDRYKKKEVGRAEDIIQFCGGAMDLHGSNIWKVFPHLRRLEVLDLEVDKFGVLKVYKK